MYEILGTDNKVDFCAAEIFLMKVYYLFNGIINPINKCQKLNIVYKEEYFKEDLIYIGRTKWNTIDICLHFLKENLFYKNLYEKFDSDDSDMIKNLRIGDAMLVNGPTGCGKSQRTTQYECMV